MAANDTLQTSEPPSWFSDEMQKFVATIQTSITTQLHQVDAALEKMSEAMHLTNTKVTALEAKCTDYEATAVDLRQELTELEQKHQKEVMKLRDKLDDYENRQRRKNLRIVGFPLGVEGANAVDFLEKWLPEILGLPGSLGVPRAFVLKLLRYRDVT